MREMRPGVRILESRNILFVHAMCFAIFVGVIASCTVSGVGGDRVENQHPRVWLSSGPPEGSTEKYIIHMYWGGWDPDGVVAYYEYAVTDNGDGPFDPADTTGRDKWFRVFRNDSIFVFSADQLSDSSTASTVSEFTRSHTFFIRAVDEEGLPSIGPAYRSFTARTLSPRVTIQIPRSNQLNPALLPPVTTLSWTATDFIADMETTLDPESTQYALVDIGPNSWEATTNYLRKVPGGLVDFGRTAAQSDSEWSPWLWYGAPNDSGRMWTTPELDFGSYVFAVRAKDEAGAITPVLDDIENVRRIIITASPTGPVFTVSNEFFGLIRTSSCNTPVAVLDIPAGVPLIFRWCADASPGGVVTGYRYGWDIQDLNDPALWEVDYTPFTSTIASSPTRTFYFGTHSFIVEVLDNSGVCSRVEIKVNIIQFTFGRSLLVVDDFGADETTQAGWNNSQSNGGMPNNEEHAAFWVDVLDNVEGFSPQDIVQVSVQQPITLEMVGGFKSIIWSIYTDVGQLANTTLLYQYVQYHQAQTGQDLSEFCTAPLSVDGKIEPNLPALVMAAGGHILITGRHPMTSVINKTLAIASRFPFMFLYDLDGVQNVVPDINKPTGVRTFAYREMCLETIDFAIPSTLNLRDDLFVCSIEDRRPITATRVIDEGLREAIPLRPGFPRLELRTETASGEKMYAPHRRSYEAEVYNPQYFFDECILAVRSRDCFEPIYGLHCLNTSSVNYGQPVAFFTSAFADRVASAAGAVAARSVVFGFPLVYFKPSQVKPAVEHILFCEWQLPARIPIDCQ